MNSTRMPQQMRLAELLDGFLPYNLPANFDAELTGLDLDSRIIESGNIFFACEGEEYDGRNYIDEVIDKGSAAVLVEKKDSNHKITLRSGVPLIPIENLPGKVGKITAKFFSYPATGFILLGVTGTNGKTSCCENIAFALTLLGYKCGVSGTLGYGLYQSTIESRAPKLTPMRTTPDPVKLQKIFVEFNEQKVELVIMEVSSHGLAQKRVDVADFNVAIFTNLSRDHLDYHGSMQAYGNTKKELFKSPKLQLAVINIDDEFSPNILECLSEKTQSYTYSLHNTQADVFPTTLKFTPLGFYLELNSPWGKGSLSSTLLGSFNVSNLLAVITSVMYLESKKERFDFKNVLEKISAIPAVKGRMEIVNDGLVTVVVDYAHTPDGLENALNALKEHFSGGIWCVFGCGGNRDKGKRPLMARIAERLADELVVTDDNPRTESSNEIIEQIASGLISPKLVKIESDRAKAIEYAIVNAKVGDVVLIAGKGHEEYQEVGGNRKAFSDVKQARTCLNKRFEKAL